MAPIHHSLLLNVSAGRFEPNTGWVRIRSNGQNFSRRKGKKKPRPNRTRPSRAKLHNKRVKEDRRARAATTDRTATISRREGGIQEDRGINRIFPKREILLITTIIPLVRNVGESTRENAVWGLVVVFCVARKATMREAAISILRVHRTNREDRDLNFTLPR